MTKRSRRYGNKNALKHGMYSKQWSEEFKQEVVTWPPDNFLPEIQLQRNTLARMAAYLARPELDTKEIVAVVNVIAVQVTAITSAVNRHSLHNDPDSPVLEAWNSVVYDHEFFTDGEPPE